MSVRYLYQRIPRSKRICNYYHCSRPGRIILRNIARDKNGAIYHYGCLQSARDEKWRCQECWMTFDATEAVIEEEEFCYNDEYKLRLKVSCPSCGSQNVKNLSGRSD
jgi:hypothetical protein